ncbi:MULTISPECIES: hypothetical protein [unclassified Myroides]|uniref:hypothetical protein n=1 Tax=unclassified Myroides TaxID=2642485 RepID=UPI003D2F5E10
MKTVIIQKVLLSDLRGLLIQHNQFSQKQLKLDYAVFFVSLINKLPTFYRSEEQEERTARLNSQIMKEYSSNYKTYIDFLVKKELIELVKEYGADTGESRTYKIADKYSCNEIVSYPITDKKLLGKFTDKTTVVKGKEICKAQRPHLVKFFDEHLQINSRKAFKVVEPYLKENYAKYLCGTQLITEFHTQDWHYSIKPESDNRLHSSLTRLNKILRAFVTYKGKYLGCVDVRTSQPYFLSVILKAILSKDKKLFKQIGATSTSLLTNKNIEELFALEIDRDEVERFVLSVIDDKEDFYTLIQEELDITYDEAGKPFRMVTNYSNRKKKIINKEEPRKKEVYESERDFAKSVVMEIFYSSSKSTVPEIKMFRDKFPSVFKIMSYIKNECVELYTLLSHIEAYCLLDYVALQFNKKYPDIPLWSIHDSLVTTENYLPLLKEETERLLYDITTLKVNTKEEYW